MGHDGLVTDWGEVYRREAKQRRQDAAELLENSEFISVELPSDPDWPVGAGDLLIGFNDLSSLAFSDLIDEMINWLVTRDGVRDATREDRELVCVWGELDGFALRIDLLAWWHERLNRVLNQP